ncbi:hypothetical protein F4553_002596 [Allocatelliglobosispora scoriae]|uniref:Uncharacterized protein n=1 Tax=Allocatelliglobosispora scoriae TaxID=643052 RepID=A0A841BJC8_9ACTN|nr:hypothetical protein [Allocatelliglobosispora scoriae]MBB5869217.1 hypothetical protein [Allocatelliglobosispora scoriae]
MRTTAGATAETTTPSAAVATPEAAATGPAPGWQRWAPLAAAVLAAVVVLLRADTAPLDLLRYAAYAVLAVALPGTLVYRSLRRTPHTFVEDVAMGIAVGLCLEIPAWLAFSLLDLRGWTALWPLAVLVPFALVPRLRRHWRVTGYAPTPLGWSWSIAGVVVFFMAYLSVVFLERNPVLPEGELTRQYLDLAYQLSLAGEAKHHFPIEVPQLSGVPLHYHWFGYVHMAMVSMVGGVDLPVVSLRLVVPGLSAAAIVLTGVIGWRLAGRPYAGVGAAVLFWVIGEITFTDPVGQPFGTQSMFVIWHGMSMIYSWVLLLALIMAVTSALRRPTTGMFVLVGALSLASSGAKASSLPVTLLALALTGLVLLVRGWSAGSNLRTRLPWTVIGLGAIVAGAQLFATAVLFHFETYGLVLDPLANLRFYWDNGEPVAMVVAAFLISMLIKYVGAVPLLRGPASLAPEQVFLLGGALAGPLLYLAFSSVNSQYFTRAGFTFGVLLAAWGWSTAFDSLRPAWRGAVVTGGAVLAVILTGVQLDLAPSPSVYGQIAPIVLWALILGGVGVVAWIAWTAVVQRRPALRGAGPAIALTAVLVAGAPAFAMDAAKAERSPNGGAYFNVPMPQARVEAARWVRDHSAPSDILVTNVHCRVGEGATCDPVSFWLSAYAERRVLVESWGFAPGRFAQAHSPDLALFWDQPLLSLNDSAISGPTADGLARLRDDYGVRWLVVDRDTGPESPLVADLADLRFDNGRLAVYELRRPRSGTATTASTSTR